MNGGLKGSGWALIMRGALLFDFVCDGGLKVRLVFVARKHSKLWALFYLFGIKAADVLVPTCIFTISDFALCFLHRV